MSGFVSGTENIQDYYLYEEELDYEHENAVEILDDLVGKGIQSNASDLHISPKPECTQVQLRVDGLLRMVSRMERQKGESVISRLKVMADMEMTQTRMPQDGRCIFEFEKKRFDLRVSTIPSIFGEKAVVRILDKSNLGYRIDTLGMREVELESVKNSIGGSGGMFLVSGPTGSGKTTTIYSLLNYIDPKYKNIVTIEDPVEYIVENAVQIQVQKSIGLDFARGLRSIIRQDPDIIMVGEIRDCETAQIAVRAAMTGHTVISSIHTGDSASVVTRLMDMGVSSYKISSALRCVVAQRLVRKICPNCKEKYVPSVEELHLLGIENEDGVEFFRGMGCDECFGTGFRGRTGVYEVMPVGVQIKRLIKTKASDSDIKKISVDNGMKTIFKNAFKLASAGITTFGEICEFLNEGG